MRHRVVAHLIAVCQHLSDDLGVLLDLDSYDEKCRMRVVLAQHFQNLGGEQDMRAIVDRQGHLLQLRVPPDEE